jgi:WD40-like Beta Propeller Repeat
MKNIIGITASWLLLLSYAAAAQQFGPWSAPVSLGPTVNSACDDQHPTLSKDGISLIFSSTRPQNPTLTSTRTCYRGFG